MIKRQFENNFAETDFLVGEDEVIDKETPLLDQNDQEMVVIDPKIENNKKKAKKDKKKKDEKEEEEEDLPKFDFMRILKMNSPEWLYLICKYRFKPTKSMAAIINRKLIKEPSLQANLS